AADISSGGPLTHVLITPDLNCQIAHSADLSYEFFSPNDPTGSCGTFLFVGGSLYGPADVPSGSFPVDITPWTSAGQSAVAGSGSSGDPLRVVTTVDAAGTGLRIEQTDSYVLGTQQYRTDIKITNGGPVAKSGTLYRAGDCYLQESDTGFGRVDDGAPSCIVTKDPGSRVEQFKPLTAGSSYMEGVYSDVYFVMNGAQFPNTCTCDFTIDNGVGLSWPINLAPGQSQTYSQETFLSPTGLAPVVQSFASSVPDPTQITLDPVVVAESVAITAGIVLLVPFPSALFNSTLEDNYGAVMAGVGTVRRKLRDWWLRFVGQLRAEIARRRQPPTATALGGPLPPSTQPAPPMGAQVIDTQPARDVWRTPLGILAFVGTSALLYSFLDPTFGISLTSLASLAGLAVGLLIILVAYGLPLVYFSRNQRIPLTVRALPASLIIALLCVLVSRIADFQPGYLYGLVIGFFFAHELTPEIEGKAEAWAAGTSLGAAFVAWVLLAFIRGGAAGGDPVTNALLQSATVTVVVAGIENAVFAMLPMRFLPGEAVYKWNRIVWIALLGLGLFAFAHVLLNPAAGAGYLSDTTRTPFVTLIVLLVLFTIASVGFWAWFRLRPSARHEESL
ncbi:MAG TPA: FGLLP motif-containing membrane protein, partial [Candidatus Limnocylindrales bacterium]